MKKKIIFILACLILVAAVPNDPNNPNNPDIDDDEIHHVDTDPICC